MTPARGKRLNDRGKMILLNQVAALHSKREINLQLMERCRSGRSGRSRKPVWEQSYRGFESLPLRLSCKGLRRLYGILSGSHLTPLMGKVVGKTPQSCFIASCRASSTLAHRLASAITRAATPLGVSRPRVLGDRHRKTSGPVPPPHLVRWYPQILCAPHALGMAQSRLWSGPLCEPFLIAQRAGPCRLPARPVGPDFVPDQRKLSRY
jgi:hypothetical protein